MAIPWPASPTNGQTFTYGGITYTWNGVAWINTVTNSPAVVGSVAVTSPIINTGTPTAPVIGISQSGLTIAESQVTGLVSDLSGKAALGSANTFTVGGHVIANDGTAVVPLTVKGVTSQSAVLQSWRLTDSTEVTRVRPGGQIGVGSLITGATFAVNTDIVGGASSVGAVIRGAASQTADLQQWQNSGGTVIATVSSTGVIRSGVFASTTSGLTGIYTNYDTSGIGIAPSVANQKGLIVRGMTSQTANLQEWQTSGGGTIASIDAFGNGGFGGTAASSSFGLRVATNANPAVIGIAVVGAASQSADLQQWRNSGGTVIAKVGPTGDFTAGYAYISGLRDTAGTGPYINTTTTQVLLNARTATNKGLVVQGAASQSANLFEIQDSTGGTQVKINQVGNTTLYGNLTSVNNATFTPNTAATVPLTAKGAVSQTANIQEWQNSGGTAIASVSSAGAITTTGLTLSSTTSPITLNASVGTSGQVLTSAGAGATPTWTNASGGVIPNFRVFPTGSYFTAKSTGSTSSTVLTMTAIPFWVSTTTTFTKIGIYVSSTGSASAFRLGIWNNNATTDKPDTLFADYGTVSTTTTGFKEVTGQTITLSAGLWWIGGVNTGSPGATVSATTIGFPLYPIPHTAAPSSTTQYNAYSGSYTSGTLPTFVGASTPATQGFLVWLGL